MWDLLRFVLNDLEVKSEITGYTIEKIKTLPGNKKLAKQLSIEIDQEINLRSCTDCPNFYYNNFFLACIYYELDVIVQTQVHIKKAITDFNHMGSKWNEILASWIYGETFLLLGREMPARRVLENIIVTLEEMARTCRHYDQYEKQQECLNHINKIKERLKRYRPQVQPPPDEQGQPTSSLPSIQTPLPKNRKTKPRWERSQLIFPVHNQLQAGIQGAFIFECQAEPDAVLNQLSFNEVPHYFYNIREEGNPIILDPKPYRWFQVKGNSMNQAEPIPIMENDYVLVLDIYMTTAQPQYGDIVVASLHDPSQEERAGVIKKYTKDGLESLSAQNYMTIPINKASIRGIAIAVAKPI